MKLFRRKASTPLAPKLTTMKDRLKALSEARAALEELRHGIQAADSIVAHLNAYRCQERWLSRLVLEAEQALAKLH